MRLVILTAILLLSSNQVFAHHKKHWNYHTPQASFTDHYIHVAYTYPNQLEAAIQWRLHHPHANISLHLGKFHHYGWHPSVIALLHHPGFSAHINLGTHRWHGSDRYYRHHKHHYYDRHSYKKGYKKGLKHGKKHKKHKRQHKKKRVYVKEY